MSEIKLYVSIGEAIDKLTILSIKLDKIKDDRRNDVKLEYEYLFSELKDLIKNFEYYYMFLKDVNLQIWELQDEIRNDSSYISSKCEEILFLNDARFTIKNKINHLSNSKFKEQKGYAKRLCYILCDENFLKNKEKIYYIDAFYDESIILCNDAVEFNNIRIETWTIEKINEILNTKADFYNFNENLSYKNNITHPYLKSRNFETLKY